jgi:hypothetical protein
VTEGRGYPLVEKNCERCAKVFGHMLVFGDGPVYRYMQLKASNLKARWELILEWTDKGQLYLTDDESFVGLLIYFYFLIK